MNSMALDTHAYYKKLIATGLRDDQAEAIASGLINGLTDNLATKDELHSEIALVRGEIAELRGDMNAMEERLEGKIVLLRSDMVAMEGRLRGEMTSMEERLEGKIDSVEERLNGKIALVRSEMVAMEDRLRRDMADMQVKLVRWTATLVMGSTALTIAAIGVLFTQIA